MLLQPGAVPNVLGVRAMFEEGRSYKHGGLGCGEPTSDPRTSSKLGESSTPTDGAGVQHRSCYAPLPGPQLGRVRRLFGGFLLWVGLNVRLVGWSPLTGIRVLLLEIFGKILEVSFSTGRPNKPMNRNTPVLLGSETLV